jgi:hypothetical protein
MAMKKAKVLEILGRFDNLPDTAVVPTEVTAAVLSTCTKTVRNNPQLPKRWVSPGRYGQAVGDIRRLVRNGIVEQDRVPTSITAKSAAASDHREVTV